MQPIKFESSFYDHLLRIIHTAHHQPHSILGLHSFFNEYKVIRLWRPGANQVYLEVNGSIVEAHKIHDAGFFEYIVPGQTGRLRLSHLSSRWSARL